jgi:hypothetical protein
MDTKMKHPCNSKIQSANRLEPDRKKIKQFSPLNIKQRGYLQNKWTPWTNIHLNPNKEFCQHLFHIVIEMWHLETDENQSKKQRRENEYAPYCARHPSLPPSSALFSTRKP